MKNVFATASAVALAIATATAFAQDEDPNYKYRNNLMKGVSAHAGSLAMIAKGDVPHAGHLAAHGVALEALSGQVLAAFKQKSMDPKSRSKEEIWSDWAGFETETKEFQMASEAVADAAKSGDPKAVGGKLKALFDTCKGCHKKFRTPKD